MTNLNIQWITSDKGLFEYDWLQELLPEHNIKIVRSLDEAQDDKNTLIICNPVVDYRQAIERVRQNGKRYGIFLLSDENLIEPCEWLHDPSCLFLVRNYINPWIYGHPKVTTVGLGYKRKFTDNLVNIEATDRLYTWTFAGTPHKERKAMLQEFKDIGTSKTHFCSGFGATDGLDTTEYSKLLNESVFALCPPGQDSMDSFRLYEALEAGCIPVVLNRTQHLPIMPSYWHGIFNKHENLPMITGDSWAECKQKVEKVMKDQCADDLQRQCILFWNKAKEQWIEEISKLLVSLEST